MTSRAYLAVLQFPCSVTKAAGVPWGRATQDLGSPSPLPQAHTHLRMMTPRIVHSTLCCSATHARAAPGLASWTLFPPAGEAALPEAPAGPPFDQTSPMPACSSMLASPSSWSTCLPTPVGACPASPLVGLPTPAGSKRPACPVACPPRPTRLVVLPCSQPCVTSHCSPGRCALVRKATWLPARVAFRLLRGHDPKGLSLPLPLPLALPAPLLLLLLLFAPPPLALLLPPSNPLPPILLTDQRTSLLRAKVNGSSAIVSAWASTACGSECRHSRACCSECRHSRACGSECRHSRACGSECRHSRACSSEHRHSRACGSEHRHSRACSSEHRHSRACGSEHRHSRACGSEHRHSRGSGVKV